MRIQEKIQEIEKYVSEIKSFMPTQFLEYKNNIKLKAACERYFEKIIETIFDVIKLLIKEQNQSSFEEHKESLEFLYQRKIISKRLADKLINAKGMRNILTHEYGNVDDKIVFKTITKELINDANEFVESVNKIKN